MSRSRLPGESLNVPRTADILRPEGHELSLGADVDAEVLALARRARLLLHAPPAEHGCVVAATSPATPPAPS